MWACAASCAAAGLNAPPNSPFPAHTLLQAFGVTGCIWAMFFMQKRWGHRLRGGRPEQCLTESVLTCRPALLPIANLSASTAFYSLNSLQQVSGHLLPGSALLRPHQLD